MSSDVRFPLPSRRLVWALAGLAVIVILREASIRRHIEDLTDWPHTPQPF